MTEQTGEISTQELNDYKQTAPTATTDPEIARAHTATQGIPSITDRIRAIGSLLRQGNSPTSKREEV